MEIDRNIFIKTKYSKRHHYLPVFYLKGFINSQESFIVYDKLENKILKNQKPINWFYEKNLNNIKFDGEIKFTIEEPIFGPIDSEASVNLRKIRDLNPNDSVESSDKITMLKLISNLYWRSPFTDEIFIKIVQSGVFFNKHITAYNETTKQSLPPEEILKIEKGIISNRENIKYFKQLVPLSDETIKENMELYDKWNLFNLNSNKLIIGDFPFLIKNDFIKSNQIFDQIIFPISQNKVLILADKVPNFIDSILVAYINASILHNSKRYIACSNETLLNDVLEIYDRIKVRSRIQDVIKNLFSLCEFQSKFECIEAYQKDFYEKKAKYKW